MTGRAGSKQNLEGMDDLGKRTPNVKNTEQYDTHLHHVGVR